MNFMWETCWQLPGPRRFLTRLVQDIAEGNFCVVCVPDRPNVLPALSRFVASYLNDRFYVFESRNVEANQPEDQFSCWLGESDKNYTDLLQAWDQSSATVPHYWCVIDDTRKWLQWRNFGTRLHKFRELAQIGRRCPSITLVTSGAVAETVWASGDDINIQRHVWSGVIRDADAFLLASLLLQEREREIHELDQALFAHLLAELARWDCELLSHLADSNTWAALLSPYDLITSYKEASGLSSFHTDADIETNKPEARWRHGFEDYLNRRSIGKSSLLDSAREIRDRVRRAQMRTLSPLLQDVLLGFVRQHGGAIRDLARPAPKGGMAGHAAVREAALTTLRDCRASGTDLSAEENFITAADDILRNFERIRNGQGNTESFQRALKKSTDEWEFGEVYAILDYLSREKPNLKHHSITDDCRRMRNLRNALAHRNVLTQEQVRELFDFHSRYPMT